jgi:hypothetical protein
MVHPPVRLKETTPTAFSSRFLRMPCARWGGGMGAARRQRQTRELLDGSGQGVGGQQGGGRTWHAERRGGGRGMRGGGGMRGPWPQGLSCLDHPPARPQETTTTASSSEFCTPSTLSRMLWVLCALRSWKSLGLVSVRGSTHSRLGAAHVFSHQCLRWLLTISLPLVAALFPLLPRRPVRVVPDPIRGAPHLLVMCEVLSPNGEPHPTNTRAQLAALINDKVRQTAGGMFFFVGGGTWQGSAFVLLRRDW